MLWRTLAIAAIALTMAVAPVEAARKSTPKSVDPYKDMEAMRFTIVGNAEPGCEPHCAEWIAADGDIVEGSASAFRKILKAAGNRKLPILINSRGGSVQDALAIGRLIRDKGLDVAVSRTDFEPCAKGIKACKDGRSVKGSKGRPNSLQAFCASSCAFILAGGVRRLSTSWSGIGVHQLKTFQTLVRVRRTFRIETRRDSKGRLTRKKKLVGEKRLSSTTREAKTTDKTYDPVEQYLDQTGIGSSLMEIIRATPNEGIHWLTPDEARTTRMVTEAVSAEFLIAEVEAKSAATAPAVAASLLASIPNAKISASASLRLGPFMTKEIDAAITLSHGGQDRPIRAEIALSQAKRSIGTREIEAHVVLGNGRKVEAVNDTAYFPDGTLAVSIPPSWFCEANGGVQAIRIVLDAKYSNSLSTQTSTVIHVARFENAAALLASACPVGR